MRIVRELTGNDASAFRIIRLEALRTHPTVFGSSFEDEATRALVRFRKRMMRGGFFGGFVNGELMGVARFAATDEPREQHKGSIGGVYVRPAARGSGLAEAIINAIIEHASTRVELLHLSVALPNERAMRFYEKLGFAAYATEVRAMKIDGRYVDEVLMVRFLL